jgi:hypothetical protein
MIVLASERLPTIGAGARSVLDRGTINDSHHTPPPGA